MNKYSNTLIKKDDYHYIIFVKILKNIFVKILKNDNFNKIINDSISISKKRDGGSNQENKNYLKAFYKKDSEGVENILQRFKNYLCGEYRKNLTIINYYNCAKRFLEFVHGNIDKENIQQWKIWANNHYRRVSSLNSNINAVNVFLKWYLDNEDEYNHLKLKVMPRTPTNEYSLNEQEYFKLLVQSRQNIETALIFQLLHHLLRPNEIINIKLQNRDKDILYLDDTKTGDNRILMNDCLQELWDSYLKIRPIPLEQYQEYLLIDNEPKWRGHKFKTTLPIRNRIYELGRQAGIEKKVKPYTIKRTAITLSLDKDSKLFAGDPEIVRINARHKKLETTMKYNKKDESYIRKYRKSETYMQENEQKTSPIDKLYTLLIV